MADGHAPPELRHRGGHPAHDEPSFWASEAPQARIIEHVEVAALVSLTKQVEVRRRLGAVLRVGTVVGCFFLVTDEPLDDGRFFAPLPNVASLKRIVFLAMPDLLNAMRYRCLVASIFLPTIMPIARCGFRGFLDVRSSFAFLATPF